MLADAPSFAAVYEELAEFCLGAKRWVAHNLPFDKGMLLVELGRLKKRANFPWPIEDFCTVENSMHIKGHRLKLAQLYEIATGEKFKDAHRAEKDTEALLECYRWLISTQNTASVPPTAESAS